MKKIIYFMIITILSTNAIMLHSFSEEDVVTLATKGLAGSLNAVETKKTKTETNDALKNLTEATLIDFCLNQTEMIDRTYPLVKDKKLNKMTLGIALKLKQNLGIDIPIKIKIIKNKIPNAFAFPTGDIYLHSGLITLLKRHKPNTPKDIEGQLAAIIGHELSHVVLRHGFNMAKRLKMISYYKSRRATSALSHLLTFNLAHSREDEYEADRHGAMAVTLSGFSFDDSIHAMRKINIAYRKVEKELDEAKLDHPKTKNRIIALKKKKAEYQEHIKEFIVGIQLLRDKDYTSAIRIFRKFVLIFPKSGMGHFNLGVAYLLRSIKKVKEGEILEEDLFYTEEDVRMRKRGKPIPHNESDKLLADDEFRIAQKYIYNTDIKARIKAINATFYTRIRDYKKALKLAKAAVGINPKFYAYHTVLGNVYYYLKNYKQAYNSYGHALQLNPNSPKTYFNVGMVLHKNKKSKLALKIFLKLKNVPGVSQKVVSQIQTMTGVKIKIKDSVKESKLGRVKIGDAKKKLKILIKRTLPTGEALLKTEVIVRFNKKAKAVTIVTTPYYPGSTKRGIKIGMSQKVVRKKYFLAKIIKNLDGSEIWAYPKANTFFIIYKRKVFAMGIASFKAK